MKIQNKYLLHVNMSLLFIYCLGLAVFGWLAYTGLETYRNEISSLYIMGGFFGLVAVAFIMAAKMLCKAARIKSELLKTTSEIQSLTDSEKSNYIASLQNRDNIFSEKELDSEFKKFLSDLNNVSKVSKETKINIKNYINYDLVDESISLHYLSQVSGVMTSLGILGTFLGLSIGLNAFDLSGSAQDLENKIVPLMDGIKVAFHTSICGLIYSILYNLYFRYCLNEVRDALDQFIEAFENNVITVSENGSSIAFAKYQEHLCQSLDMQLESQNAFYAQQNVITQMLIGSLQHQESLLDNLLSSQTGFYDRQNEKTNIMVDSMLHQDKVLDNLVDGITQQIAVMMRDIIVPSVGNMTDAVKSFAEMTQKNQLEGLEQIVTAFIQNMNSSLGDSFSELGTVINETNAWQKKSLSQMEETLNKVNGMSLEMASINESFAGIIYSIEMYEKNVSKLQERVIENVEGVNKQIELNNSAIEKQSESVNSLIENGISVSEKISTFIQSVKESVGNIEKYNNNLTEHFGLSLEKFGILIDQNHVKISESIEQTQKTFTDSMMSVTNAANDNIIKSGEVAYGQLKNLEETNGNISKQIEDQMETFVNKTRELNDLGQKTMLGIQTGLITTMEDLSNTFKSRLEEMQREFTESVTAVSVSSNESLTKSGELLQSQMQGLTETNNDIVNYLKSQIKVFAADSDAVNNLTQRNMLEMQERFAETMNDMCKKYGEQIDILQKEMLNSIANIATSTNEHLVKSAEMAQAQYEDMASKNASIIETLNIQIEAFAEKTEAACENAYSKISEAHNDFADSMDDIVEVATNKMEECVDTISKKLSQVLSVNRDITESINKAAEMLGESAKKFNNSADAKLSKTFATFDAELTTISKHFGAAILELQKTLDKVPVVVEDVYGDVDHKFESIRKTLDEYLEYADKLHRNLEFKWKQLQDEMGKNK